MLTILIIKLRLISMIMIKELLIEHFQYRLFNITVPNFHLVKTIL